ncbi:DUF2809 domain-containing protein [Plebeiibacterium sediminum]|uniref:DUF2809 domain-containing protein n=1 Tax=Plebeiibacterium sediminum TaxID=2992112 RepID=A0AAE3M2R2_9BACT|nr:DUF2809 domain-containing protein [Plebeiobacterium sediminum]MCW3785680.1 DUF2809 domain-containing protein [Plebeiobacterium sediminum]
MNRNRIYYVLITVVTIVLGLASRQFADYFPFWIKEYLGDVLWALMVFWMFGVVFKRKQSVTIAAYAILFSFGIELSQLYHDTWIDAIRNTRLGGLVLGFGFLWSDLICYTIGVAIGFLLERFFYKSVLVKK